MLTRRYDVVNFHGTEEQSVCWSHRKPATQCPPDTLLVPFHATFRWNDRAYLWLQAHSAINAAFSTKMGFRSAKCANDLPPPPYTACFILWVLSQLAGVAKRSKANQPGLLDKSLVNRERERESQKALCRTSYSAYTERHRRCVELSVPWGDMGVVSNSNVWFECV